MLLNFFEKSVTLYPDRIALQFEDEKPITYQELDHLANQMAYSLQEKGVSPRQYVLLYLPRSSHQVIAYLALLKLGAIAVPTSSEQLPIRIKQICEDCKPTHILTTSTLKGNLTDSLSKRIFIDELDYQSQPSTKPSVEGLTENDIAYLTYSSGTTGNPKGIPSKNAGFSYWEKELSIHINHSIVKVAANVSLDFDAHIWECFMAWLYGAALHITSEDTRKDIDRLAAFISKHQISDITLTPSVTRAFKDEHLEAFKASGLKEVYSTGEACTIDIIKRFTKRSIGVANCYGPTEAHLGVSVLPCQEENFYHNIAPIGMPSPESGVRIKIIDETGAEVKEGNEGELVIISPFITPGYLNREEEKSKFTRIKGEQGEITEYKTGDKFMMHNNKLYYLGRMHSLAHIKIRGQFVDIEGIEQVLRREAKDAYVVVRNDLGPDPMLIAFIISDQYFTLDELRKHCKRLLPPSSIPSYFVMISDKELPRTLNGKVDREKLIQKAVSFERDSSIPYVSPKTLLETELVQLWNKLLIPEKLKITIGIKDPFAMMGGNSIQTMTLISQINNKFKLDLMFSELGSLEDLTIEKLANIIYTALTLQNTKKCIKLLKEGDEDLPPLFMIHDISGIPVYSDLLNALKTPRSVYTIQAPTIVDSFIMGSSIEATAEAYVKLILEIQPKGDIHLLGWSSGGMLAYAMAAFLELKNKPVKFLGIIDEIAPDLQHQVSNEDHAKELMNLIERFAFKVDCKQEQLNELSKEKQILTVFENIPNNSPIKNILEHIKCFMLNFLHYQPKKLNKTPMTIFSAEKTSNKISQLTHDSTTIKSLGWNQYSTTHPTIYDFKDDHFSIISSTKLAEKIDSRIQSVTTKSSLETQKIKPDKELYNPHILAHFLLQSIDLLISEFSEEEKQDTLNSLSAQITETTKNKSIANNQLSISSYPFWNKGTTQIHPDKNKRYPLKESKPLFWSEPINIPTVMKPKQKSRYSPPKYTYVPRKPISDNNDTPNKKTNFR